MAQDHSAQTNLGMLRGSWRISFAYRDDEIEPVAARQVAMVAPGGATLRESGTESMSGAWIDLASREQDVVWRRGFHQPNRADQEAFNEDGSLTRVQRETVEGEFEVVVPDLGPEAVLTLYASPAKAPDKGAEPRLRIALSELARLERDGRLDPPDRPKPDRRRRDGKSSDRDQEPRQD